MNPFNPRSGISLCIFVVTLALIFTNFFTQVFSLTGWIVCTLYVTLLAFAIIPWYGWRYKGLGIEEHFEKIFLIVTYFFLPHEALLFFGFGFWGFDLFLSLIFLPLVLINGTLLFYHFTDKDKTPPAYYAKQN